MVVGWLVQPSLLLMDGLDDVLAAPNIIPRRVKGRAK
jgi:hypothetical protein